MAAAPLAAPRVLLGHIPMQQQQRHALLAPWRATPPPPQLLLDQVTPFAASVPLATTLLQAMLAGYTRAARSAKWASTTRRQLVSLRVLLVLTVKRLLMARLPVAQRQHATLALLDTSSRVKNVTNALQALIQAWGLLNALIARQDTQLQRLQVQLRHHVVFACQGTLVAQPHALLV